MTEFVDVRNMVRCVMATGAEQVIAGIAGYLRADFRRWGSFDKTPRVASHTSFGVIELMPVSDPDTYAFKYVNGHPLNPARGFQTVTAFGALADVSTGYPVFLAEMTLLTALRTGATSAVAAAALARPDARRLALIGAGGQAEFQALGMRAGLGIEQVAVWDTDPAAMIKLARNLEPLGFTVTVAASGRDAVHGADVVTTCTADKTFATVLPAEWVEPGMHINAIGGDCPGKTELDPAILRRARVFVEYTPQTRIEGEIQTLEPDFPVVELWEVLTGRHPGRTSDAEVTVFDSVGFAVEDFSALRYLRDSVRGTPWVDEIDLVAEPENPKDLFGMVTTLSPIGL
jgi:ornithine cyclodeaminase